MRLLYLSKRGEYKLTPEFTGNDRIPPYGILSHRWLSKSEEVSFKDLERRREIKRKAGYDKLRFLEEKSRKDGLEYFWIDTCCINKDIFAEEMRSINSMFLWYRNAKHCYAYLLDVSVDGSNTGFSRNAQDATNRQAFWESAFRRSDWFLRAWTLQELIAPRSVKFFSRAGQYLGDKDSLSHLVYEITNISQLALQGGSLSQFSTQEKLTWRANREAEKEEDKAYSLLGIFGVFLAPMYGEGLSTAFTRLYTQITERESCMRQLHLTEPRSDMKRIIDNQGRLPESIYQPIYASKILKQWRKEKGGVAIWVKGLKDAGKTMLLCRITEALESSRQWAMGHSISLAYFFCQADDDRLSSSTAVLRGLIYQLIYQQPSLFSYLQPRYNRAPNTLFDDANAWNSMSEIFTDILKDRIIGATIIIVDGLDTGISGWQQLWDLIIQQVPARRRVKWIVSSRNSSSVEKRLRKSEAGSKFQTIDMDNHYFPSAMIGIGKTAEDEGPQNYFFTVDKKRHNKARRLDEEIQALDVEAVKERGQVYDLIEEFSNETRRTAELEGMLEKAQEFGADEQQVSHLQKEILASKERGFQSYRKRRDVVERADATERKVAALRQKQDQEEKAWTDDYQQGCQALISAAEENSKRDQRRKEAGIYVASLEERYERAHAARKSDSTSQAKGKSSSSSSNRRRRR